MKNYSIADYYKRFRAINAKAVNALEWARRDKESARSIWKIKPPANIEYNPASDDGAGKEVLS